MDEHHIPEQTQSPNEVLPAKTLQGQPQAGLSDMEPLLPAKPPQPAQSPSSRVPLRPEWTQLGTDTKKGKKENKGQNPTYWA